jgi:hypothetical protein
MGGAFAVDIRKNITPGMRNATNKTRKCGKPADPIAEA